MGQDERDDHTCDSTKQKTKEVGQDINAPATRSEHRKQCNCGCDGDTRSARSRSSLPPYYTSAADCSDDAEYCSRSTYS